MESHIPDTLPRGHIATTATDGRRLMIYYIRDTKVDDYLAGATTVPASTYPPIGATATATVDAKTRRERLIKAKLLRTAEIEVLRNFAASYTRGDPVSCQMTVNFEITISKIVLTNLVLYVGFKWQSALR